MLFITISCTLWSLISTSLLCLLSPAVAVTVYVPATYFASDVNVAVFLASSITAFTPVSVVPFVSVRTAAAGSADSNVATIVVADLTSTLVIAPSI